MGLAQLSVTAAGRCAAGRRLSAASWCAGQDRLGLGWAFNTSQPSPRADWRLSEDSGCPELRDPPSPASWTAVKGVTATLCPVGVHISLLPACAPHEAWHLVDGPGLQEA